MPSYVECTECISAYHCSVGDETDKRVLGQQADARDECCLESRKILLIKAGIDNVEEDRRDLRRPRERVFDRRVLGEQLRGQVRV